MYLNDKTKKQMEEVSAIIRMCEERMCSLEESIKSTSNQGVKALMQKTYVLNSSLHKLYKTIYARLSL